MDYRKAYKRFSELADSKLGESDKDLMPEAKGFANRPKKEEKKEEESMDQMVLEYIAMFRKQANAAKEGELDG